VRIYLGTNPHQIAVLLEAFEEVGQIVVGHAIKYRRSGVRSCGEAVRHPRRSAPR